MRADRCIFAGPSLDKNAFDGRMTLFSPAVQGSLFLAVESGFRRIGLVDGLFGNTPSVWHKEIIYALSMGVEVFGAASMGALRAAETHRYGMLGVGKIFRYFSSGILTDDDEVCVLHTPLELGFSPLTHSLASLRDSVRILRRAKYINKEQEIELIHSLKRRHFSERTLALVRSEIRKSGLTLAEKFAQLSKEI